MPAIENPISGADQNPEMAFITIHGSRLNLSVMDIQKLARMEDQKNASIYVQKDLVGLWRQIHLDEFRTTKCLELLQQLAKELSPPAEEVPIDVTKPELSAHIKDDPRVHAIQEKIAAQVKVCGEKEIRVKEATENTRRPYGPWVKAMKKAGKDLKIEKGKLKKLRHEEESILAEIGEFEKTK